MTTQRSDRLRRRAELVLLWFALAVPLLGLWLALVDNTLLPDLLIGVGAAIFAALGAELAGLFSHVRVRLRIRWLLRGLLRAPGWILRDSAMVLGAALGRRRPAGRFRARAFSTARGMRAEDVGRRTLAKWLGSIGPDCYVVGVLAEERAMLMHELASSQDVPAPELLVRNR